MIRLCVLCEHLQDRLPALVLCCLLLLHLGGCASRQDDYGVAPQDASPVAHPAPLSTAPLADSAGPDLSAADKSAAKDSPLPEQRSQKLVPARSDAPGTEGRVTKDPTPSPVRQMLFSAGRDPEAEQPEAGFSLQAPVSIGDGEAFLIEFGAAGAEKVILRWRDREVVLPSAQSASGRFQALLPVPLDAKEKSFRLGLTVHWAGGKTETFSASLPVKKRKYPVQRLKVDSKYVSPPPEVLEKIKRDRAEMRAAVTTFSNRQYWSLPLQRPVPGAVTSLYGSRRVFNGVPKAPHRGVDFDADEGDPIAAVEDGVVVLVSEHYYGGNTVVIDHGLGVLSAYLHLSGFAVSPGERVSRGQAIGFIGSTGRVTGPHLHFSLYVLGESLNASPCLAL